MSVLKRLQDTGALKAFWDFRRGTLRDWSGNGYNQAAVGSPKWITTPSGMGVLFQTASSGYLSAGNPDALKLSTTLTMIAVCTPMSNAKYRCVFGKDKAPQMYVHNANLLLYSGGTSVTGNSIPRMGVPTMLGGTIRLDAVGGSITYVNGVQGPSGTLSATNQLKDWLVGANYSTEFLDGSVQFAGITDSILTSQQMAQLYLDWMRESFALEMPHRKFSFPYRTLTPAQAVAQGLVLDTDFVRRSDGKVRNLAPTAYAGTLVGNPVPAGEGEGMTTDGVDDDINFGDVTELNAATKVVMSAWIRQNTIVSNTGLFMKSNTGSSRLGVANNGTTGFYAFNATSAGNFYGQTAITLGNPSKVWQHFAFVFDGTGATNADRLKLYVDGTQTPLTYPGGSIPAATNNAAGIALRVGSEAGIPPRFSNITVRSFRVRAGVDFTAAEVRAEYLEGAKRLLLDGRLRADGSCPVSLTSITTPNTKVPGTIWQTNGTAPGGVKVLEDSSTRERYIDVKTGILVSPQPESFGSWYFEWTSSAYTEIMPIASQPLRYSGAPNNGYGIFQEPSNIYLYRFTNGIVVSSILFAAGVGAAYLGKPVRGWLTRTPAGVFSLYFNNGSGWVLLGTGTDTTHTTSSFWVHNAIGSADRLGSCMHFQGAMTPVEATSLGLIDP